jgi:hypothetical protein
MWSTKAIHNSTNSKIKYIIQTRTTPTGSWFTFKVLSSSWVYFTLTIAVFVSVTD